MRILVLAFHPDFQRSNVNRAWAQAAEESGLQVIRIAPATYNPSAYHPQCEAADRIVFQHPMHWYGPPWIMKRWIDEVLKFGWAYGDRQALAGKEWMEAVTVGAPYEEYGREGTRFYTVQEFLAPLERTAAFIGMKWTEPHLQYGAGLLTPDEISASAQRYLEAIRK